MLDCSSCLNYWEAPIRFYANRINVFKSIFVINIFVASSLFAGVLLSFLLLLIDIVCLSFWGNLWKHISRTDNRLFTVHLWSQLEKPYEGYIFLSGAHMTSPPCSLFLLSLFPSHHPHKDKVSGGIL